MLNSDLQLRLQPLRSRLNSLIDLLWLLALSLARRLLTARLASNDVGDDAGPLLGCDALCMHLNLH